jgi:apolipoprotein N-acyltransferase
MTIVAGAAAALSGLAGWRRWGAAALAGTLVTAALPPFNIIPALMVAFVALVWLLDGAAGAPRSVRGAFALGWWFGFAHFVTGLYWISHALLVDAATFGWLVPFAVAGLSAYFALFPGLAVMFAGYAAPGWPRVLALAGAWTLGEYLRGVALTGFPWNPVGSALQVSAELMQGAALGGAFGLSLVAVLIAALPAVLARPGRAGRVAVGVAAGLLVALWIGGAVRLAGMPAEASATGPRLRVVQGAVDQASKWQRARAREHFERYLSLSRAPGRDGAVPDVVIWPETAVPAVYDGSADFPRALAQAVVPNGMLITGVIRRDGQGTQLRLWNSIIAVSGRGRLVATYDKHHLVPFGEYVPLARFNPVPKLTAGRRDFSAGPGPATVTLPGLAPFSPLVCYEAIFPGRVVAPGARPGFLLNLTNDAWFGISTGPYQHLAAARLRAVEEGLPLVRAANTGISALIDAQGRVRESLGLGLRGVLDVTLPAPTATFFARFGNGPALAGALLILLFGNFMGRRKDS